MTPAPSPLGSTDAGPEQQKRSGDDVAVRVVCVDDNRLVLDALLVHFRSEPWLKVVAMLHQADDLPRIAADEAADVVLLDIDMPGADPFEAMAELARSRPETRTIIVTGHLRADLVDKALAAGAWGYLCKTAGPSAIVEAIRLVHRGEFAAGPDGLA